MLRLGLGFGLEQKGEKAKGQTVRQTDAQSARLTGCVDGGQGGVQVSVTVVLISTALQRSPLINPVLEDRHAKRMNSLIVTAQT